MEYAPESVLSTTLRFITEHVAVFPNDSSLLPPAGDACSLVALAPKYGLVFAGFGTSFKVYQAQSLLGECEKKDVTTVNTGSPITHLVSSCDGLTLMTVILQGEVPHALFYECRNFVPGCGNQTPIASVALGQGSRVRVMGIAWNPTDPSSVAVATSPGSLSILTLKDNAVDVKTVEMKACAVGWSPKGKQLTVGLADGSLALFKPDLTPVRNIVRPPMDELGAVLSVTWFTSTEFFIGYKQEAEEGGHVMMFVSAPKGKEPKFVLYEFLCNDNQGPRPPMFYPIFISEWSVLCVMSSRAVQLGVLGKPASGEEAWCEYEMEEGSGAGLHNISVTKETYALGMAVDFTSLKSFTHKDGSTSGPCPVLYALSTGGELNIFHFANAAPGVPRLTKLAEALPNVGHRTADQYPGFKSYATLPPAGGAIPALPGGATSALSGGATSALSGGATSALSGGATSALSGGATSALSGGATSALSGGATSALSAGAVQVTASPAPKFGTTGGTGPAPSPFKSMAQTSNIGASPFQQAATSTPNNLFMLPQSTSSSIFGTAGSSNMFGTAQQQVPQGVIAPSASTTANSLPTTFTGAPSQQFRASVPSTSVQPDKPAPMGIVQPQVNKTVPAQVMNLPSSLPKADSTVGSISQGKPALTPMSSTPLKSKSPTPVMPKALEMQMSMNIQSPSQKLDLGKSKEPDLRPAISAIQDNFEKELLDHINNQSIVEIGKKEDMGEIRSSLTEQKLWIDQMSTTSADQKTEVTQLHSKVLEGFTLLEEAEGQLQKRKNPRHMMSLQSRPLDPQSRRMLEEIRSRYQYLQSQLTEVITKLHLDWAEFLSASSSKKKKDLPASETLYHALLKCHSYRISLEKQVDLLCEKVKTLQLHSLSGSLQGSYKDDDEILANLEKSMKDTSLSSVRISPVKFLPPEKQEKLQRLLAQRKSVPIRKYTSTPRVNLTELQSNSSLNESSDHVNSSLFVNHSSSTPALDFSSFGPQTFSTPNHKNSISVNSNIASPAKECTDGLAESTKSGFHMGGTPSLATSSPSISLGKPQYEDITPPQTPSVKPEEGAKSSNPLSALTSFVLKVPKTTPVETKPSSTISFSFNGASPDPPKAASSSTPSLSTGFSFIGANSSTSVASVASGSSLSLPTPSTNSMASANAGSNTSFGTSFSFKPPVTSNNLFSNMSAPSASCLPSIASSTNTLSFSAPSSSLTTTAGSLFSNTSLGTGIGSLPVATQITTSLSSTVMTAGSGKPVASSAVAAISSTTNTAVSIGSSFTGSAGATGSIFGNSTASSSSIFSEGSTGSSMFGGQASNSKIAFGATATTTASLTAGSSTALSTSAASDEKTSGKEATGSLLSSPGITVSTAPQAGAVCGGAGTSSSTSLFSSAGSLFGGTSSVTIKAILSSSTATSSSPTSAGSIFSQSNSLSRTSLFTPPSTVTGGNLPAITSGSIFASAASSPTQAVSSFGSPTSSSSSATSTSGSIFSSAGSSGALFSSTTSTSTSSGNMFGTAISSPPSGGTLFNLSSASSSVSKTTPVASAPGGMFGGSTTSTSSPFGSPTVSAAVTGSTAGSSTGGSVFAIAATSAGSLFGTPTTTTSGSGTGLVTTSSGGVFGTPSTPASSGSLLGSPTSPSSTFGTSTFGALTTSSTGSAFSTLTSSGFSLTATTTTATGSVFGQTSLFGQSPQSPTSSSVFGAQTTTSGSIFGSQPTSTSSSVFGSQPASTSGSVFGSQPTSTSGSVFGSQPTSTSGSVFGSQPSSTSGSVFGAQPTSSSGSVFGSQPASSSGSVFGTQPTSTTGSVFGSPTSTSSIFGNSGQASSGFGSNGSQSGSIFGGASSTIGSAFGQPITSSGFGSGTSGSVFGQTSTQGSSPFNASNSENSSSSVFGSGFGSGGGLFSGLGGKPSQENANKNVFGSMNFNDAKPQSGLFSGGASQTGTFGGGMTFGGSSGTGSGGSFTSPVSQTGQSGFGATTPQKSTFGGGGSTFGGAATFGSSPVFGSPPKFGNSATFGGNATFGSPVSSSTAVATGSASPSVGFGSFGSGASTFGSVAGSTTSPSGFGSFAAQGSAASFSSLAQQSQAPSAFGGGGGGTFGSSSSFSSWRS